MGGLDMLVRAIRIATAVLLTSFLLFAQSQNSSITGTVTDPSGAAVPNAELTLTSLQRNTAAKVTTGADGLFTFPNLEPGSYELKVVAQGFRQAVVRPIPVTINQLPLIVAGGPRNSAQFTVLLPGVSTGGGNDAFDARINGGLQSGDE